MDTLRISFTALVMIFMTLPAMSQEKDDLSAVFSESYVLEKKGEYGEAIRQMKSVYDEASYEINIRLGWLHYMSGLFIEAIPYYEKCIVLKPFSIEARLGLVNPASAMGNWSDVEKNYVEILEIDPEHSLVNYRMGLINYNREDYQQAFWHFEKVVNHYPFDYDAVIMLAWTNFKMGKMREARVLFQKALLIRPNDDSALEGLSLLE
jgi:tetratricopeptide (TPR) repeat protein